AGGHRLLSRDQRAANALGVQQTGFAAPPSPPPTDREQVAGDVTAHRFGRRAVLRSQRRFTATLKTIALPCAQAMAALPSIGRLLFHRPVKPKSVVPCGGGGSEFVKLTTRSGRPPR